MAQHAPDPGRDRHALPPSILLRSQASNAPVQASSSSSAQRQHQTSPPLNMAALTRRTTVDEAILGHSPRRGYSGGEGDSLNEGMVLYREDVSGSGVPEETDGGHGDGDVQAGLVVEIRQLLETGGGEGEVGDEGAAQSGSVFARLCRNKGGRYGAGRAGAMPPMSNADPGAEHDDQSGRRRDAVAVAGAAADKEDQRSGRRFSQQTGEALAGFGRSIKRRISSLVRRKDSRVSDEDLVLLHEPAQGAAKEPPQETVAQQTDYKSVDEHHLRRSSECSTVALRPSLEDSADSLALHRCLAKDECSPMQNFDSSEESLGTTVPVPNHEFAEAIKAHRPETIVPGQPCKHCDQIHEEVDIVSLESFQDLTRPCLSSEAVDTVSPAQYAEMMTLSVGNAIRLGRIPPHTLNGDGGVPTLPPPSKAAQQPVSCGSRSRSQDQKQNAGSISREQSPCDAGRAPADDASAAIRSPSQKDSEQKASEASELQPSTSATADQDRPKSRRQSVKEFFRSALEGNAIMWPPGSLPPYY